MGKISPDKKVYDQAAVDVFTREGWMSYAVELRGWYSDVLAVKNGTVGIIEVKSPKETSAVKRYDDSAKLSSFLDDEIGDYLKTTRLKVFGLFPQRGQSIEKLYAVAIACQVYRYVHEFEERVTQYETAGGGAVKFNGTRFEKKPFLVVPKEYHSNAGFYPGVIWSRF